SIRHSPSAICYQPSARFRATFRTELRAVQLRAAIAAIRLRSGDGSLDLLATVGTELGAAHIRAAVGAFQCSSHRLNPRRAAFAADLGASFGDGRWRKTPPTACRPISWAIAPPTSGWLRYSRLHPSQ